ncbi:MAG: DUF3540 domain-containing protein [Polyangiaceae bacterium]
MRSNRFGEAAQKQLQHLKVVRAPAKAADEPVDELRVPDGGVARIVGDSLEFRDAEGRLLVRYQDGALEVCPAKGDLRLRAPEGRVHIEAATDIRLEAGRDVELRGARAAAMTVAEGDSLPSSLRLGLAGALLSGRNLELRSQRFRQLSATLDVVATTLRTHASRLEIQAKEREETVERAVLRARELKQEVTELLETRAGRVRTLVKSVFRLHSQSTDLTSDGDTAIDGRRVLLG